MKRFFVTLLITFLASVANADGIFNDSFEYGNHDGETPVGWIVDNESWLSGYLEKDHNRKPHSGNWYAYTNSTESWMFMPLYLSEQLRYRFSLWVVTDGEFQIEIWAGNEASSSSMTQLLLSDVVSNSNYLKLSAYIDEIASNYEYFGIHAVSSYGSNNILTIDDINVDMVDKYGMICTPASIETQATPGMQKEFHFRFTNTGYEPLDVFMTPTSEYFSDFHLYANGIEGSPFHAEPDETVEISGVATMHSDIAGGSLTWFDIMFTLACDCATTMFTLWATAEIESTGEFFTTVSVYPNPSSGNVTIEGCGVVTIANLLGQQVFKQKVIEKETVTLDKGIYFLQIGGKSEKVIIR